MGERWLVTGATGLVGSAFCSQALGFGADVLKTCRRPGEGGYHSDLAEPGRITWLLNQTSPDRVFHFGAIALPSQVEQSIVAAYQVNVRATQEISEWCERNRRWMCFTSTDHVFDGAGGPYREEDLANPKTTYGKMKRTSEKAVLCAGGLVVRLGWVLNDAGHARRDFLQQSLERLQAGATVRAVDDEIRTPVNASFAVRSLLVLARRSETGLVHLAGSEHATPFTLLVRAAMKAGCSAQLIERGKRAELSPPDRPADIRLNTDRLNKLLELEQAQTPLAV